MSRFIAAVGSLRLTLAATVLLAAGVWRIYPGDGPVDLLAAAIAILAVNLVCAIAAHPRLRKDRGLFVLHLALLALFALVAMGWLTRFEGRLEVVDGQRFADAPLEVKKRGWLHPNKLNEIDFVQNYYTVDYAPALQRAETHSRVWVDDQERVVGDDRPLIIEGYRLYTTHNKGFSLVLAWTPTGGATQQGTVNLPRYPYYDWMQENRFTPPGGPEMTLKLKFAGHARPEEAWQLDSRKAEGELEVHAGQQSWKLGMGDSLEFPQGSLRYVGVRGWMGYQVYYDPTLPWLFWTGILMAAGLAWHILARPVPKRANKSSIERGAVGNVA